ncbi:hypothetical protein PN471_16170 [Aphanizomenon sp. CS-733/32]|nr:hypothetical protein [Aphanizomenon sp. CS-733/32]MDB9310140.1 hypothetical protein [Aphanizomenon sp. CS-733/32]
MINPSLIANNSMRVNYINPKYLEKLEFLLPITHYQPQQDN